MKLTAEGIRVSLGQRDILHGVDFAANAGELTVIVGPNGSGKTTLLKAITGDVPTKGRILLNGLDMGALKPWELAAMRGVLPQISALAFPFQAIEVVRVGLQNGITGDRAEIAMEALAWVGLADKAGRFYEELSGGEQQRVQFARVLAQIWEPKAPDGSPKWLFLDEPVASLDIAHQFEVMDIAADFAKSGGGVVAVMHDLNLTALYADHVAVLSAGTLLADGPPLDVMTDQTLSQAYGCRLRVNTTPDTDKTFILPQAAARFETRIPVK